MGKGIFTVLRRERIRRVMIQNIVIVVGVSSTSALKWISISRHTTEVQFSVQPAASELELNLEGMEGILIVPGIKVKTKVVQVSPSPFGQWRQRI
ncbi:hypothetical protein COLO4_12591 [Corchorus olitorius]|uniref:Uncharacterized protein n=1 Tax=Corchorus olitorius TaxID=93759 RepID=A0A1R3K0D0_9ROSI|nr:hypothetical protein COLO4_12591 [Corchorus olitorius]